MHADPVAERGLQFVPFGRREAAETGHDLTRFHALDHTGAAHEVGLVAVEIGLARLEIMLPPPAGPGLAFLCSTNTKGPVPSTWVRGIADRH